MASRNQRKKKRTNAGNASNDHAHTGQPSRGLRSTGGNHLPRSSTETKSSLRTTELIAYVATVLAIIMTALAVDADGRGGADPFGADTALRYITYLTVGYMVARGLAKAGSWRTDGRDITDEQADAHDGTHDPRLEAEPDRDATGEDRFTATSHARADGTSNDEPGASDASDADASEAPVAVHPAGDDAPTGARSR